MFKGKTTRCICRESLVHLIVFGLVRFVLRIDWRLPFQQKRAFNLPSKLFRGCYSLAIITVTLSGEWTSAGGEFRSLILFNCEGCYSHFTRKWNISIRGRSNINSLGLTPRFQICVLTEGSFSYFWPFSRGGSRRLEMIGDWTNFGLSSMRVLFIIFFYEMPERKWIVLRESSERLLSWTVCCYFWKTNFLAFFVFTLGIVAQRLMVVDMEW